MTVPEQVEILARAIEAGHFSTSAVDPTALDRAEVLLGEPVRGATLEALKLWTASRPVEVWAALRSIILAWNERLR